MFNKNILIFGAVLFLIVGFLFISEARGKEELRAHATLINAEGEKVGTVLFNQEKEGVRIKCRLYNLEPGPHALHIHETAECDPPDFKSAGGHFNPYGKKHGFLNPAGPHAGDLPNFEVRKDKTADIEFVTGLVTLKKDKRNSLLKAGGTSVVMHENPDDYITDPAGQGGARIACGIIKEIE